MDTDDLSQELYEATIITASTFHEDLRLQFGLLAGDCKDEEQYLEKSLKLLREINDNLDYAIDEIFFEDPLTKNQLIKALKKIESEIEKVKQIPISKRTFNDW